METEDNSIFDEINEELKHDEVLKFIKDHQNTASWIVILIIAGIVIHSAWYSNKKQRLELSTTSLYNEVYSSAMKNEATDKKTKATLQNLLENAPSELVPLISLIKTGREVATSEDSAKTAKQLLEISEKRGVDIIWRDLAILMYVSYRFESDDKLLGRLEELTEEDRPFRFSAMEKMAMIYDAKGDHDKAVEMLDKVIDNKEAPNTMKKRLTEVRNYIKNHKDGSAIIEIPEKTAPKKIENKVKPSKNKVVKKRK